jgi:hypothetical protein
MKSDEFAEAIIDECLSGTSTSNIMYMVDNYCNAWINVDEKLPKISANAKDFQLASGESDQVLVWMNGYHLSTYHVNINQWSLPFHHGDWKPTHWKALAMPPKDATSQRKDVETE